MKYNFNLKNNSSLIQKYVPIQSKQEKIKNLTIELFEIEQQISETTQELLEVQMVALRARWTKNNSLYNNLKEKFYSKAIKASSYAHRERLIFLHKRRTQLKDQLDKLNGQYWANKAKRWLKFILIAGIFLFAFWLIFISIIATLYLLPIWLTILFLYIYFQRKSPLK